MVLTSIMIKNSLRKFARCGMFDSSSGCDHFEWIDDSLCNKVKSMVVHLIMSNETLLEENQHLQRLKKEAACDKGFMKTVKEKNSRPKMESLRLKMQLHDYHQMR